ncbi:MAG: hypothetical protein LBP59_15720 [Planctomycetaceae bacterium]|jgi:tetratricopeptide (TPR) repeat protein|nr:hypothetical protein [Planctomycetaceae bacterium]
MIACIRLLAIKILAFGVFLFISTSFYFMFFVWRKFGNVFYIYLLIFLILFIGCKLPKSFNPLTASRLRSVELEHLGNTALDRGDNRAAEKYLSDALRLNRRDIELRRSYAESLWQQGKQREAIEQLKYAQKHGGQNSVMLNVSLAEKLLATDDIDGAYSQADEAIRLAPQDARGWTLRAKTTLTKIQKQLTNLNNNKPKNTNPQEQQIVKSEYEKLHEQILKSRNDYYRAISIDPDNRNILGDLAKVQLLAGQPEHSLVTLQNLQEQYPPDALPEEVLRCKAQAYIALKKYDEANRCLAAVKEMTERK